MKKFKKLAIILGVLSALILPICGATSSVYATGENNNNSGDGSFLGMYPWYHGLTSGDEGDLRCVTDDGSNGCIKLSAFIWTAASNVAVDLAVVAALGAIGFIIYGGYLYMFSGGESGKVAAGKKTITNAIIDLAIAMLAKVIFTIIKGVLLNNANSGMITPTINGLNGNIDFKLVNATDPGLITTDLISWAVGIAGVICVIFLVYGGVLYMTSSGDSGKVKKAKDSIMYALIGLAIVGLAQVILAFVANTIRDSQKTSYNNTTTQIMLAKEANEK